MLLTGRLSEWGADIQPLELDVLEEADAARFLLDRTDRRRSKQDTDEADAAELAHVLGGLALALEHAAAYIVKRRRSLAQYLADWQAREPGVREWYDERVTNYPRSVAVTWNTTVAELSAGELALLRLLAWFAPEPVPQFVFEAKEAESIWRKAIRLVAEELDRAAEDGDLLTALSGLAGYSMVRWEAEAQTISVHRVVQEILRGSLDEAAEQQWLIFGLSLTVAGLPGNPHDVRTWTEWDALRPHVAAGARFGEEAGAPHPTNVLMNELGQLLRAKELNAEAEPLMRRALEIDEASYGSDHPKMAIRLNNLAQLLQATNRLGEAEPLMRRGVVVFLAFSRLTVGR